MVVWGTCLNCAQSYESSGQFLALNSLTSGSEPYKAQWQLYVPRVRIITSSAFCPQCVLVSYESQSKQVIIYLNGRDCCSKPSLPVLSHIRRLNFDTTVSLYCTSSVSFIRRLCNHPALVNMTHTKCGRAARFIIPTELPMFRKPAMN
jgi:hypothetical protein